MNSQAINNKQDIINKLRRDIQRIESYTALTDEVCNISGLKVLESNFLNNVFPTAAIHEFICSATERKAATIGFIGGILSSVLRRDGVCLWVSTSRTLFASAMNAFNVMPENIIFVLVDREKEVLWATEEGLKCNGITAVVAEVRSLTFTQSRRLQLAVEHSKATGFIMRTDADKLSATACTARWEIIPQPCLIKNGLPGVGNPCWQVELLKVRNGKTGKWLIEWVACEFNLVTEQQNKQQIQIDIRKAG